MVVLTLICLVMIFRVAVDVARLFFAWFDFVDIYCVCFWFVMMVVWVMRAISWYVDYVVLCLLVLLLLVLILLYISVWFLYIGLFSSFCFLCVLIWMLGLLLHCFIMCLLNACLLVVWFVLVIGFVVGCILMEVFYGYSLLSFFVLVEFRYWMWLVPMVWFVYNCLLCRLCRFSFVVVCLFCVWCLMRVVVGVC